MAKSEHIQIRVTPDEKAALKRRAAAAGQDVSSYVLAQALPASRRQFAELLERLADGAEHRYVLAELNDLLTALTAAGLVRAVAGADVVRLPAFLRNYIAAMVEQACHRQGVAAPSWTAEVLPLETPHFATSLKGLRLHLLQSSPVPFKRRNIFVDSSLGARV